MEHNSYFKNKKVLVFGLGLLGGGIATTNWLLKRGAKVSVTDLKDKKHLADSIRQIKSKVNLILGGHRKKDINAAEVIVANPDVSINSEFIKYAVANNKTIENEATIFYKLFGKPIVAVTGTRGKTTTVSWINHFLSSKFRTSIAGNIQTSQFLKVLDMADKLDVAVAETSSFHLEYFSKNTSAPHIAVITNIYQDHLNRHKTLKNYAITKANIFKNQTSDDFLILNMDNKWTPVLLKLKPKAKVMLFSSKCLRGKNNGVYPKDGFICFKNKETDKPVLKISNFEKKNGSHNLENLLASSLAAHLAGCSWPDIQKKINSLPSSPFRQEVIFDNKKIKIINDTTATSPEGGIAAARRFAGPRTILITGGTDKELDFTGWAKEIFKFIEPQNIIFISGSATDKMLKLLGKKIRPEQILDSLNDCVKTTLKMAGKKAGSVVLFSPSSKSFEKFKNEYDRGEKFNKIVKKYLKHGQHH